ncbi:hypothetical protein LSH36_632g00027 [Paralvinella palmiformis]|uniref:Uncharacterized protein n=1 Tax=Paralvinella palmiformis TaxID=53620 RepID=A0AAD9J3S1_9ANNE|nr:hypothetical protein LSH36_632g00027 [Paralvinella palmiformis]
MGLSHPLHIIIIISAVVFQIITMGVQIWAMDNYDITREWYKEAVVGSSYFSIEYGPPKWLVLLVWAMVYVYQILWTVYVLSTLWRKTPLSDERLYYRPYFMPLSMYVALLISLLFRLSWVAILPNCNAFCPVLQLGATLTMAVALAVSLRALVAEAGSLYRLGLYRDVTIVRALTHNGFALYATWELIDLTISTSGVMVRAGYSQKDSYVTMLGILGLLLVVYILLDVPVLDVYLRYLLTPYFVFCFYCIAIITDHTDSGMVYVTAAIILAIAFLGLCFKLAVIVVRKRYAPEPILFADRPPKRDRNTRRSPTRAPTRAPVGGAGAVAVAYI